MKVQSDCFGIKRSRKRPTDWSLQQTLPIMTHMLSHMALKSDKIYQISVTFVGNSGYFLACAIFRTSFCWREVNIWKISTYNPKNLEYSWPCCESLSTLWCDCLRADISYFLYCTRSCPSATFAHQHGGFVSRDMSNNEIMQFPYFSWKTNEKKIHREIRSFCRRNLPLLRYCVMPLDKCIMGYYSIVVCDRTKRNNS